MALVGERFELGPRIGRGAAGDVHRAVDTLTGEVVAVKLVDLEEAEDEVEARQSNVLFFFFPAQRLSFAVYQRRLSPLVAGSCRRAPPVAAGRRRLSQKPNPLNESHFIKLEVKLKLS